MIYFGQMNKEQKIKNFLKIFGFKTWKPAPIKKKDKCHPKKVETGMKVEDILKSIEDVIQVKNIFIFENGNVAVCDNNGKQIPFLQGILSNSNIVIKQSQP